MSIDFGGKSGNSKPASVYLNNFELDLGLESSRPRSLNSQRKNQTSSNSFSCDPIQSRSTTTSSWQPNKPSWTHHPVPSQVSLSGMASAPTSMVGDISGKSWNSNAPSASNSVIGIVNKSPNLFSDLVGPALGKGKSNCSSNVPLKNATPSLEKNTYSMSNLGESLPKTSNSTKNSGNWGSSESFTSSYSGGVNNSNNSGKCTNANLGGLSMKSIGGNGGIGDGISMNKDPFVSLVDFGSRPMNCPYSESKTNKSTNSLYEEKSTETSSMGDDIFGDFQNATKLRTPAHFASGFADNSKFVGLSSASKSSMVDFGVPNSDYTPQRQSSNQRANADPLETLFSLSGSARTAQSAFGVDGGEQFCGIGDLGWDSEFGGGNDSGDMTTELEGLPPPPAGVTAATAKSKGVDNHKQGQFADAIKWLSWAIILFEKGGHDAAIKDVLSCRASCYKEVGEYKKAVADCTKVLESDGENVNVLVQRAMLYESMEKYKLGAEDLRNVLKIDPGNRIARSTVHRLTKMAE